MKLPARLHTPRLDLRLLVRQDRDAFVRLCTHPGMAPDLLLSGDVLDAAQAGAAFDRLWRDAGAALVYVLEGEDGVLDGCCGLAALPAPGVFECFYALCPRRRGRGLAVEALSALLAQAFATMCPREVRAYVKPANQAARRVAERVGLLPGGIDAHPVSGARGCCYVLAREEAARCRG